MRSLQILYKIILGEKKRYHVSQNWPEVILDNLKYIQNLQTSQGYIFIILKDVGAKLCNFTNLKMLFLAVVIDFVLLAKIKI